ncbi:CAAX amino protease [Gemmobacter aquaticus]|uniref:CAAX amino protease n=1 Tax=Gemmobacter aquaticus TaxID=490185 RepID=A0A918DEU2_9RHOB|nr:type II CAAX endopeptidase family protein [Gemmobacter aquaticus]GGO37636.1 CAAX amino protease [Gemmobacter aquaticus]
MRTTDPKPNILLRILHFPLVRVPILGGILFLGMGISNGFIFAYADQPLVSLVIVLGLCALALAVYWGFVRFVERRPVTELAKRGRRQFGMGLWLGFLLYAASIAILMWLGAYRIGGVNSWLYLLPMLPMAISSGVFEELIHRGVLFRVTEEYLGSWIALAASSLVFGLRHLGNEDGTLQGALFLSVEAGVLLAAAFMLTRRLWLGMGFHMSWNYTQGGIFSGAVSGNEMPPGLIAPVISGPELLTGGKFGVEASIIAFALCTVTGLILLVMAIRSGRIILPLWRRSV